MHSCGTHYAKALTVSRIRSYTQSRIRQGYLCVYLSDIYYFLLFILLKFYMKLGKSEYDLHLLHT